GQLAPGLRQQVDDLLRDVRTPAVRLAGVTGVARTVTAAGVIRTGVAGTGVTRSVALVVSAAQVEARIAAAVQVQLELVVGLLRVGRRLMRVEPGPDERDLVLPGL